MHTAAAASSPEPVTLRHLDGETHVWLVVERVPWINPVTTNGVFEAALRCVDRANSSIGCVRDVVVKKLPDLHEER